MKEDNSWVKLYRKIKYWQYYGDVYVKAVFLHLLIEADHETKMINQIKIERGSTLTSVSALCLGLQMSPKAVKRALKLLVESGDITDEVKPNKYRIITVKNYNKYQSVDSQGTNKGTNKGTTNNKYKKSVSLTEKHSEGKAKKPRASSALVERPGGGQEVTLRDVRQYQIDNRIGDAYLAAEFFHGFERSGTKFPKDWQDLYRKYAHATYEEQEKFSKILNSGGYRKKWGAVGE